jgi:protein-S-isoprenylcysteine O-methyltransferase Ste14
MRYEGEEGRWRGPRGPEVEELEQRPLGDLVSELFADGKTLLREEVRVAKAELREEARKAGRAAAALGAGGAVLHAAALCLAAALVLVGATFLPAWLSALIVTALLGVAGWAAMSAGRKRPRETDPSRAVRNLKEDGRWARETMRSIRSNGHENA